MLQDDEKATAWNFELTIPAAASARYVRFRATPKRILCASELQVLDRVDYGSFDIRVAATRDQPPTSNLPPTVGVSSPTEGAAYINPASLTIAADATDSDGAVTRVDFLVDGTLIETDSVAPWSAAGPRTQPAATR